MSAPPPPIASAPPIIVEILVEAGAWPAETKLKLIASRIADRVIYAARPNLANDAELSIVFTDDIHIRALNRQFRNVDKATNVLSFPSAPASTGRVGPLLGDVVLAHETILGEAKSGDLTIEAHLAHLIVHGVLHILGYDHVEEAEALIMERLETEILDDLGIADPYCEPSREIQQGA